MSERCRYVFLGCRGEPPWTRLPYTPSVSLRGGAHSLSISVYLSSCILSKCVYGSLQVGKDFEQGPYSQGLRPLAQPFQEKPAGHPADRVHVNVTSSFRVLCMLPLLSSSTLDIQIAIFKAAASLPRPERNWADQRAPIRHQDSNSPCSRQLSFKHPSCCAGTLLDAHEDVRDRVWPSICSLHGTPQYWSVDVQLKVLILLWERMPKEQVRTCGSGPGVLWDRLGAPSLRRREEKAQGEGWRSAQGEKLTMCAALDMPAGREQGRAGSTQEQTHQSLQRFRRIASVAGLHDCRGQTKSQSHNHPQSNLFPRRVVAVNSPSGRDLLCPRTSHARGLKTNNALITRAGHGHTALPAAAMWVAFPAPEAMH